MEVKLASKPFSSWNPPVTSHDIKPSLSVGFIDKLKTRRGGLLFVVSG